MTGKVATASSMKKYKKEGRRGLWCSGSLQEGSDMSGCEDAF